MYRIWFKEKLGGHEMSADCATIEAARKLWQTLQDAGYVMMCTKP